MARCLLSSPKSIRRLLGPISSAAAPIGRGFCSSPWILTGALSEEIASTCRVPEPVIDEYESLFFSIRNAIKATTYCWQAAIRCRRVSPKTPAALEKLIRQWAYFGGKYVLATALPAIGRHGVLLDHPADLRTAEGRRAEHVRLAAKLFMAADDLDNAADLIRALPVILRAFDRMPAHQPACVDGPLFDVSDVISRRPGRSPARPARQAA